MAATPEVPLVSQPSLPDFYLRVLQQFQDLHAEKRLSDEQLARITAKAGPQDVIKEVQNAMDRKQQGRSAIARFLGRVTDDVLQRIDRFSSVIDICIQSNPTVSALVWGCLKFLIIIGRDISDSFENACKLVEGIIFAVVRFSKYLNIFQKRSELLAYIFQFYEKILDFAAEAVELYTRSTWRTLGKSLWASIDGRFRDLMQQIDHLVDEVDKIANAEHMADQEAMRKDVEIVRRILESTNLSNSQVVVQSRTKIWMVPDLLHAHFTGRVDQLDFLKNRFFSNSSGSKNTQQRAAIYGIPGVGKTQLGMKYLSENRTVYQNTFYISARSELAIINDFCRIASILRLPEAATGTEPARQVDAALQWFSERSGGGDDAGTAPWVIFYDNISAEDLIVVRCRYLPPCEHGHVLFTTRDESVAQDLVNDDKAGVLHLEKMSEDESVELIMSTSGNDASDSDAITAAKAIAKSVSGLPIALDQVAAFTRRGRKSLAASLERLRLQKGLLLSQKDSSSKYEAKGDNPSTTAMIRVALEDAERKFTGASLFFKLVCFFEQEYVPISFLAGEGNPFPSFEDAIVANRSTISKNQPGPRKRDKIRNFFKFDKTQTEMNLSSVPSDTDQELLASVFSEILRLDEAIHALKSTGLIQQAEQVLWIHDLFAAIGRDETTEHQKNAIIYTALRISSRVLKFPNYNNLSQYRAYLKFALKSAESATVNCLDMYDYLGHYFFLECDYESSVFWLQRAVAGYEMVLGEDHPCTLASIHGMTLSLRKQGCFDEAIKWCTCGLTRCERSLGEEQELTTYAMISMASLLCEDGRFEESLEISERVLAVSKKVFGEDHAASLETMNGIGGTLAALGRYEEALEWLQRVLSACERWGTLQHVFALTTVYNKGFVLTRLGRYYEALECAHRCLSGFEKSLGYNHRLTLESLQETASISHNMGRFDDAIAIYKRLLTRYENSYGKEDVRTLELAAYISLLRSSLQEEASELSKE